MKIVNKLSFLLSKIFTNLVYTENKVMKNIYSQQGFAERKGISKSTVSSRCSRGALEHYETEDGKRLIEDK